jgi:hypothetical protein
MESKAIGIIIGPPFNVKSQMESEISVGFTTCDIGAGAMFTVSAIVPVVCTI